jgi:hypothetical protein
MIFVAIYLVLGLAITVLANFGVKDSNFASWVEMWAFGPVLMVFEIGEFIFEGLKHITYKD